jgi:hypothetical protein
MIFSIALNIILEKVINYSYETGYSTANVSFYEAASVETGISLAIQLIKI